MAEPVIMIIKNDGFTYGESRSQPFIVWLQFMNFAMLSAICWIFLKIYRGLLSLYEWIFPLHCNKFYNPLILDFPIGQVLSALSSRPAFFNHSFHGAVSIMYTLIILHIFLSCCAYINSILLQTAMDLTKVIGNKNDLNKEIMKQLSCLFRSNIIQLQDLNDNLSSVQRSNKGSLIIYTQVRGSSKEEITKLSSFMRRTFGEIDLLLISQNEEPLKSGDSTHGFLNNLNKQLLTQFWIVMAFLPGMLQRNHGHIISVAQGRTSSLTNTGIVRSVCEELLLSDTNVKLKLVERNSFVDEYLPALPSDILARLIIRSIWTSSSFVRIPSISQYFVMIPVIIARSVLHPVFRILNIVTSFRMK